MSEIKCPKCHTVFTIDEADYKSIAKQIRDNEFNNEIKRQLKELEEKMKLEIDLLKKEYTREKETEISIKNKEIDELKHRQEMLESEYNLKLQDEISKKEMDYEKSKADSNNLVVKLESEIRELKGQLKSADDVRLNEVKSVIAQKELEKEKEKISANMEYILREIRELDEKRDRIMQQQDGMNIGTRERSTEDLLELRIDRVKRRREQTDAVLAVVLLGGIAGTGCLAAFSGQVIFSVLAGVATAAISVAALFFRIRLSRELNKRERQRERWHSRHEELTWNRNSLDSDYEEKHTALENLQAELTECEENTEVITPEETEIQALNMAMETIEALSGNITDQVGVRLKKRTSEILSEITGGRYQEVLMDEALHMSVNTGERIVSIERLSRGTLEQIYFALRMAAGELFCKEEPFPVILDDVFGMYDEERLAAALRWLHKENRQVIISTCHKREMEILDKERIPYQKLPM